MSGLISIEAAITAVRDCCDHMQAKALGQILEQKISTIPAASVPEDSDFCVDCDHSTLVANLRLCDCPYFDFTGSTRVPCYLRRNSHTCEHWVAIKKMTLWEKIKDSLS